MLTFWFLFFFTFVFSAPAIPTRRSLPSSSSTTYVVLEEIKAPPDGFESNGPADPGSQLNVLIGLKSDNRDGLESTLYSISTPGSKKYGQHLSKEEVKAFAAPSEETTSAVQQWLADNGINSTNASHSGDWIKLKLNISQANALFNTSYHVFTHKASGKNITRSLTASVPAHLKEHIDVVHPTTTFPSGKRVGITSFDNKKTAPRPASSLTSRQSVIQRDSSLPLNISSCDAITPDCILALYGMPRTVGPQNRSQIAVSGFLNEFPEKVDLLLFLANFRQDLKETTTFSVTTIDDGQDIQNVTLAGTEGDEDVQYTVGMAGGVPVNFISVGDNNTDGIDGFLDLINSLLAQDAPPQVLTTSYGFNENDLTPSLAFKLCDACMQLTSRGVSIFFSTGDGGVSGSQPQSCTTYVPTFPSTCPYVTSVGATTNIAPESAAFLSAGGFSNVFPVPPYQKSAVSTYLKQLGSTNAGLFNSTGRGFPDVSAQGGVNIVVIQDEQEVFAGGTSASTPIFASVVAMVNALRFQENKTSLGFLNPMLYANPDILTDILFGSNPGCNTDGFPAMAGWDPLTGLGTPNFDKFKALP